MKKILISSMLFFSVGAQAQIDTTELYDDSTEMQVDSVQVKLIKLPDSTAVGAPDGTLVSKEIVLAGGTIISDDGRVELIFPAGALSAKKTISIQPIVNLIPNGNGKGYQFEPSGLHFIKPVEIIFHYTKEEEEVCPAQLKFMAIQDKNGKWEYMDYDDWDSTTKSLKGHISHFSAMVEGNLVELLPQEQTMRVGEKRSFYLSKVLSPEERSQPSSGNDDDELASLPTPDVKSANKQAIWSVTSGTIHREPGEKIQVIYTAPRYLPRSDAPVIVRLKLNTIAVINDRPRLGRTKLLGFKKTIVTGVANFTATIHLWDEYNVVIKDLSEVRAGMGIFEEDMGSFDVKIVSKGSSIGGKIYSDDKIDIDDIHNYTPAFTKKHNPPKPFKLTVDNGTICQGKVDIGRLIGTGHSSSNPNAALEISIQFDQHEVLVCKVLESSKPGLPVVPVEVKDESIPIDFKFKANGEDQIVDKRNKQGYGSYISIIPVRDK